MALQHPITLDLGNVIGPKGKQGDPGPQGEPGMSFLTGQGAPDASRTGVIGDLYLDATTMMLYILRETGWEPASTQPFAPSSINLKDPEETGITLRDDTKTFLSDDKVVLDATKSGAFVVLTCKKPIETAATYFYHGLPDYEYDSHDFGTMLPVGYRPPVVVYGFALAQDSDGNNYFGEVQVDPTGYFGIPRLYKMSDGSENQILTLKSLRFSIQFIAAPASDAEADETNAEEG